MYCWIHGVRFTPFEMMVLDALDHARLRQFAMEHAKDDARARMEKDRAQRIQDAIDLSNADC